MYIYFFYKMIKKEIRTKLSPLKLGHKMRKGKQKQNNFVLDCTNILQSKLQTYSPVNDKFLNYFIVRVHRKPKIHKGHRTVGKNSSLLSTSKESLLRLIRENKQRIVASSKKIFQKKNILSEQQDLILQSKENNKQAQKILSESREKTLRKKSIEKKQKQELDQNNKQTKYKDQKYQQFQVQLKQSQKKIISKKFINNLQKNISSQKNEKINASNKFINFPNVSKQQIIKSQKQSTDQKKLLI